MRFLVAIIFWLGAAMPLFSDPTPRIERAKSVCTVVSTGGESPTHAGISGIVSFSGRTYPATLLGAAYPGGKAHFIQTKDSSIWGIRLGSFYRSAFPKNPGEWAGAAPASLAILQLMKRNRKKVVFKSGIVRNIESENVLVSVDGTDRVFPVFFELEKQSPLPSIVGKKCLIFASADVSAHAIGEYTEAELFNTYTINTSANLSGNGTSINIKRKTSKPVFHVRTGFSANILSSPGTGFVACENLAEQFFSSMTSNTTVIGKAKTLTSTNTVPFGSSPVYDSTQNNYTIDIYFKTSSQQENVTISFDNLGQFDESLIKARLYGLGSNPENGYFKIELAPPGWPYVFSPSIIIFDE